MRVPSHSEKPLGPKRTDTVNRHYGAAERSRQYHRDPSRVVRAPGTSLSIASLSRALLNESNLRRSIRSRGGRATPHASLTQLLWYLCNVVLVFPHHVWNGYAISYSSPR
jgi:hypothetical protein